MMQLVLLFLGALVEQLITQLTFQKLEKFCFHIHVALALHDSLAAPCPGPSHLPAMPQWAAGEQEQIMDAFKNQSEDQKCSS